MRIAGTQFNVSTSTLEIYLSGCTRACSGCHNPELQDFHVGENYIIYMQRLDYQLSSSLVDNIAIMGGEPLAQGRINLEDFIKRIKYFDKYKSGGRHLWLYTGFDFEHIPLWIKSTVDYIKCGAYDENLKSDNYISCGVKLASTNQKVYKRGIDY